VTDRIRTGTTGSQPRMLAAYTTTTTSPKGGSAGGIRTHDLELMRLARTAAPLPRRSGWQDSNLRSPAPKAGGVAVSPTTRR
jgi:hypothetical protein